jgi:hypothetical protein
MDELLSGSPANDRDPTNKEKPITRTRDNGRLRKRAYDVGFRPLILESRIPETEYLIQEGENTSWKKESETAREFPGLLQTFRKSAKEERFGRQVVKAEGSHSGLGRPAKIRRITRKSRV